MDFTLQMKAQMGEMKSLRGELVAAKHNLTELGAASEAASKAVGAAETKLAIDMANATAAQVKAKEAAAATAAAEEKHGAASLKAASAAAKEAQAVAKAAAATKRAEASSEALAKAQKAEAIAKGKLTSATAAATKEQAAMAAADASAAKRKSSLIGRFTGLTKSAMGSAKAFLANSTVGKKFSSTIQDIGKKVFTADGALTLLVGGIGALVAAVGAAAVAAGAFMVQFTKGVMGGAAQAAKIKKTFAAYAGGDLAKGEEALKDIMEAAKNTAAPVEKIAESYGSLVAAGMDNQMAKDFAQMREDWMAINPDEAEAAWGKITDNLAEGVVTASQFEDIAKNLGGTEALGKALGIDPAILSMKDAAKRAELLDKELKKMDPKHFLETVVALHKERQGLGETSKAAKSLGERWESLKELFFMEIGKDLDFGLGALIDEIQTWLQSDVGKAVIEDIKAIYEAVIEIAQAFAGGVFGDDFDGSSIKEFTNSIKEYLTDPELIEGAKTLGVAVRDAIIALAGAYQKALPHVKSFLTVMGEVLPVVWPVIKVIGKIGMALGLGPLIIAINALVNAFLGAYKIIKGIWQLLSGDATGFETIMQGVGNIVVGGLSPILYVLDTIGSLFGYTGSLGADASGVIMDAFTAVGETLANLATGGSEALTFLMDVIAMVGETIYALGATGMEALGYVTGAIGSVGSAFSALWESVASFSLLEAGMNIANSLVEGIVTGITSGAASVVSSITSMAKGAVDTAKGILGIASPSKVFEGIGEFMNEGMAEGMSGNNSAESSAKAMAKDAVDAAGSEMGQAKAIGASEISVGATEKGPSMDALMKGLGGKKPGDGPLVEINIQGGVDEATLAEMERRLRDVLSSTGYAA